MEQSFYAALFCGVAILLTTLQRKHAADHRACPIVRTRISKTTLNPDPKTKPIILNPIILNPKP